MLKVIIVLLAIISMASAGYALREMSWKLPLGLFFSFMLAYLGVILSSSSKSIQEPR